MEWSEHAIVLGARAFGEGKLLAELFARGHGRFAGVVHGGRKAAPALQAGNLLHVTWKARTGDQLGFFSPLDLVESYAARVMDDRAALAGLASAISLIRIGGAERQAYPGLYDALILLLDNFGDGELWPPIYARFELGLLAELGYGLDLERCAITGETENLAFVSPRTGRAATFEAGEPFADKLLRLPPFVLNPDAPMEEGDVADALALAGYFLERRVFDHIGQGMPEQRRRLIEALGYSGRL
jgi:DNA repair protein RecO (recombination protein O)